MHWKVLLTCALLVVPLPALHAADPTSYREIAMLLRNGEDPQFIITDTARRKLLQPITPDEEQNLLALHAPPALITLLHDPATLASPDAAAAYASHLQQQKLIALQQEQLAAQQAAARARLAQQQQLQQQQQQQKAQPPAAGGADPADGTGKEFIGKPLTLKFNAADGSPVDLTKMHGKVVLVDFWATWCGPCMKEVPNVVAAYAKYHSKGFEIVGISLDQKKDVMLKVTAEKGMTWPQYFDGKGWNNEISTAFHIRAIPAMWLVDKNGLVVTTTARDNLDAGIAQLLAQ